MSAPVAAPSPASRPELDRRVERIARARERLERTLRELRSEADERLDWRGWVRRHPFESVALAAASGFVLARIVRAGRSGGQAERSAGPGPGAVVASMVLGQVAPLLVERLLGWLDRTARSGAAAASGPREPER